MAVNTHAANTRVSKCPSMCSNRVVTSMCILHGMMYCIILIEYSSKATIKSYVTEHFTYQGKSSIIDHLHVKQKNALTC